VADRDLGAAAVALGLVLLAAPLAMIVAAGRWHDRPRHRARLARLVEGASHARTPAARIAVVATTCGVWGSHVAIAVLALQATGTAAGLGATAAASAAGNLAFALPVSGVLGLGAQQVAFAATLEIAGVGWTRAVAAALAVHTVVAVTALGVGLACWLGASRATRPSPAGSRRPAGCGETRESGRERAEARPDARSGRAEGRIDRQRDLLL
jgi:uncharacterized membrane protein YbhN (UPF0104 family)